MAAAGAPYVIFKVLTGHATDFLAYQGISGPPFYETDPWYPRILGIVCVSLMCFLFCTAVILSNPALQDMLRRHTNFTPDSAARSALLALVYNLTWNTPLGPIVGCFICTVTLSDFAVEVGMQEKRKLELSDLEIAVAIILRVFTVILCIASAYSMFTTTPAFGHNYYYIEA